MPSIMPNQKKTILILLIIAWAMFLINVVSASLPITWIEKGNHTKLDNLNWSVAGHIFDTDLDLNGHKLTEVGELIMQGVITSQNIIPITDNLYSIGNSTNWFKEIFVRTIYADDINTTNLVASDINTKNLDSGKVNTTNLIVGGFDVYKDVGGNLNIDLD